MRKKTVLLALLLILILSACANQNSSPAPASQPAKKYVGSVNSDKYHRSSCEWARKIKPNNEIWFSSAEDAHSQGYVACKVCRP